jgi:hypothetical protein
LRIIAAIVRSLSQPASNVILGTHEIKRPHEHACAPSENKNGVGRILFVLLTNVTLRHTLLQYVFTIHIYTFAQISSQPPFAEEKKGMVNERKYVVYIKT